MSRSFFPLLLGTALAFSAGCGLVTDLPANGTGGGSGGGLTGGAGGSAGGSGGAGGQPADGGKSCDQLVSDYDAAMVGARACTPGADNQCAQLVAPTLAACTLCQRYVNDATALNAIRAQWLAQGCLIPVPCPQILCLPVSSSCTSASPGSGGPGASPPAAGMCS